LATIALLPLAGRMVNKVDVRLLVAIGLNTMAFRGIPATKTNNASALINLARNFAGSIGISATLLAYLDDFKVLGLVFLCCRCFLLLKGGKGGAAQRAH
jgi:hypothetical protein